MSVLRRCDLKQIIRAREIHEKSRVPQSLGMGKVQVHNGVVAIPRLQDDFCSQGLVIAFTQLSGMNVVLVEAGSPS